MVYFICGHKCSGKSYVSKQVKNEVDCCIYDTGPILREQHLLLSPETTFQDWLKENEMIYGKNFTNEILCKNMAIDDQNIVMIVGNRSLMGINYIINYFNISDYKIVYIDCDYQLLLNNYNKREKKLVQEEFNRILDVENQMGIEEIEELVKSSSDRHMYFHKNKNNEEIYCEIIRDIKEKANNKIKMYEKRREN